MPSERNRLMRTLLRRKRLLLAVGLTAVLVIAGVVVAVQILGGDTREETVARDYLEALRQGDIEGAMEHVHSDHREPVDADSSYLVEEALSSDWEITAVESTREGPGFQEVAVTLTAHGVSSEGVFAVGVDGGDGPAVLNPYVRMALPAEVYEEGIAMNGFVPETYRDGPLPEFAALFPGSYRLFDADPEQQAHFLDPFVVAPNDSMFEEYLSTSIVDEHQLGNVLNFDLPDSARFNGALDASIRTLIDTCAANDDPDPRGCPFRAAAPTDDRTGYLLQLDFDYYETKAVDWEVVEYPGPLWWQGAANPDWTEESGWVSYTATGRVWEDGAPIGEEVALTGYCPIHIENIVRTISPYGLTELVVPHRDESGTAAAPYDCTADPPA